MKTRLIVFMSGIVTAILGAITVNPGQVFEG
jgi:hypothetical protein